MVLYYLGSEQQRHWSACADESRLICTFVVRILHKQVFSWHGSNGMHPTKTDQPTYEDRLDQFSLCAVWVDPNFMQTKMTQHIVYRWVMIQVFTKHTSFCKFCCLKSFFSQTGDQLKPSSWSLCECLQTLSNHYSYIWASSCEPSQHSQFAHTIYTLWKRS